jgi:hypothetical protein
MVIQPLSEVNPDTTKREKAGDIGKTALSLPGNTWQCKVHIVHQVDIFTNGQWLTITPQDISARFHQVVQIHQDVSFCNVNQDVRTLQGPPCNNPTTINGLSN